MSRSDFVVVIVCCVAIFAALMVVGAVSHGVIRHIVQTAPLWVAIVLARRGSPLSKWAALPCWAIWLFFMGNIWSFLLGLPHFLSGTFSPIEIAMTLVVGVASLLGLVKGFTMRSGIAWSKAAGVALALLILQLATVRISFLPAIAHR